MTKEREALKLALEALEVATTPLARDRQEVLRAQAALREALAEQPAQQQEPYCYHDGRNIVGKEYADHSDVFPLYTSPPASKPLTDEQMFEMAEIAWRHGWASCRDADYVGEEAEDERWGMVGAEVVQDIAAHGIKEQP